MIKGSVEIKKLQDDLNPNKFTTKLLKNVYNSYYFSSLEHNIINESVSYIINKGQHRFLCGKFKGLESSHQVTESLHENRYSREETAPKGPKRAEMPKVKKQNMPQLGPGGRECPGSGFTTTASKVFFIVSLSSNWNAFCDCVMERCVLGEPSTSFECYAFKLKSE